MCCSRVAADRGAPLSHPSATPQPPPPKTNPLSPRVCAAPFGGPVATVRDERAMVAVRGAGPTRPVVRLFNAAGVEAGSFLWDKGRLAGWGWSDAQELVLVEPTGKVGGWLGFGVFACVVGGGAGAMGGDACVMGCKV